MLDHAITTQQALRLLSRPVGSFGDDAADGPHGWTRRSFLQAIGLGIIAGPSIGAFGNAVVGRGRLEPSVARALGPDDGILVVISLYGGNDGLNTVVPYADGTYYDRRPGLAVPAVDVLPIDGRVGLHPRLAYLKALSDAGQLAVVEGVGSPQPDYSHFRSMGLWMDGSFTGGSGTGWVGRWLDRLPADRADLAAASIDLTVPLHMSGAQRRAVGIAPGGDGFGADTSADRLRLFDCLRQMSAAPAGRGPWHDMYAATMRTQLDLVAETAPVFSVELPPTELARKLTVSARLINANLGLRVFDVSRSGFDNHESEAQGHSAALADLDEGVRSFFSTLAPEWRNRVTLMTVSEFGRTIASNGSGGTDHGTAAPLFVIGAAVRGGLYGQAPSLTSLNTEGQMTATVDFRSVYGSVLESWMGGGASEIIGGSFENLHLFRSTPGAPLTGRATPIFVVPPASASGFVPLSPLRIVDTRDGTGGRSTALGPNETWTIGIRNAFGVPADAVAVAFNLTSVDATHPTFVTVWPSGLHRPLASNLNPVPGRAVPNSVVARLGVDGALSFYNNSGSVDLVADLVGYFSPSSSTGLTSMVPARLMDTRDGTGGLAAAVGPGDAIQLQVTGRGGVPSGAVAVALNVAATEPTAPSFLTVWPADRPRPLASNVNMVTGQTVPNLVLSGVGPDGTISVFNNGGATHVVVDVLGSFSADAGGKFVPLPPCRVLDTRDGTGAPARRIDQSPLVVALFGRGGLPSAGVGAVMLNVTAVSPTRDTYITVYPAGIDPPLAANLNVAAGDVTPNMVIGTLGADGAVSFFNHSGDVDLVADVLGYFSTP